MKVLSNVIDVENEGLVALLGKNVELFCLNYIYAGKLAGVNATVIKLSNAHIVYETGPLNDKEYKDAQKLPNDLYVQIGAIESFSISCKL